MSITRRDELIIKALYLILFCVVHHYSGEDFKTITDKVRLWKKEVKTDLLIEL